jgi:Holliday junction resolvasome RuvABC ATP-dependent DNA helicase subunit
MSSDKPFAELFGQKAVKQRLSFYLSAFEKTSICPFLFLVGAKGLGKTEFARQFGYALKNRDGKRRPFLELNCSTIKNVEQFFDQIFIPLILDNEITVLFDEAHELPKDLTNAFLTVFNTEKGTQKSLRWRDGEYPFDFKKQTFLFATTEPDKVFAPLKDRLTTIDFDDYSDVELGQILQSQCEGIIFDAQSLEELARTSRGNARSCVMRAKELELWCAANDKKVFTIEDFGNFCKALGINPLGVNNIEKKVLAILRRDGQASLNELSAKTGLSRTALQRDVELYLMKKNLIKIDGKRHITKDGSNYLDNINNVKSKTT